MNKKRIIGLDLLRVVSMIGIVGLHVINQGALLKNTNIYTIKYYAILILLIFFFTSVDVFAILSGYLNIDKKENHHNRIVELLSILFFYCFVISTIYYISVFLKAGTISDSKTEILINYFPILKGSYWYITNYTFLFFMIPYINRFCKGLDKKDYKNMLAILFVLLSILPNLLFKKVDLFKADNGYSALWLMYCYMIGGYIKLYKIKIDKDLEFFIGTFIISIIINSLVRNIGYYFFGKVILNDFMIDYISPLTIILSILLLLIFRKIKINNQLINTLIIWLSNASFSVYIIHGHRIFFYNYFPYIFIPLLKYNFIIVFFGIILIIALIYIICTIVDLVRIELFKLFRVDKLINIIGEKIDKQLK